MMHEYTSLAICTLVVNWTLTLIALLIVLVVCYSKLIFKLQEFRLDDILVLVAFVISLFLVSLSTWAIADEGQGKHQQDVSTSHLEIAAKSLLVSEALWTLVTSLLRIAAGLFIDRLIGHWYPQIHAINIGIRVLSPVLAIASIVQIFLICKPFAAQWDPQVLGSCGDQVTSFIIFESAGLVLDIAILALPLIPILRLNMTRRRRTQVALVLNTGAVVLVITGLRMAALRNAVSPDFTYSQSYLSLLSSAGCMTGVICCMSPAISVTVQMHVREFLWWRRSRILPAHVSEPAVVNSGGMRTASRQEEDGNDYDLEKASSSRSGTVGVEKRSTQEALTGNEDTSSPFGDEVNVETVALVDYDRFRGNGVSLKQGQLAWDHDKRGDGWLLAQDLTTNKIGLVPEKFLQLKGGTTSSSERKLHMRGTLQSHVSESHACRLKHRSFTF